MGTTRLVLRTDKPTSDGKFPIELIYQLSGKRKYFRTKEKLRPENWNATDQKAVYIDKKSAKDLLPSLAFKLLPTGKEIKEINDRLATLRTDITNTEKKFETNKIVYSADMVVDELKSSKNPTTKKEAPSNQVFDFIDNYITDHSATTKPASLSVYKALKKHLEAYQVKKKVKVKFADIDLAFFQAFQNFLISRTKKVAGKEVPMLYNVTIAKQLSTLKTFLKFAEQHKIKIDYSYKEFKIKKEKLEVIALTSEEFEAVWKLDLSGNKRLDQVRDIFCFSCATGLRYSDLAQLKREHIKRDEIRLTVTKTKERGCIPLNPYSYAILAKHADHPAPLPVTARQKLIVNQKMNEYVKELCNLAGINDLVQIVRFRGTIREENSYPKYELVSAHTGRKTFACLSLEKGMSAEEVMKIGGWESYASFKRYVNITEKRVKVVMSKAWGEITHTKLKAV